MAGSIIRCIDSRQGIHARTYLPLDYRQPNNREQKGKESCAPKDQRSGNESPQNHAPETHAWVCEEARYSSLGVFLYYS